MSDHLLEERAAAAVAFVLGARAVRRDVGGQQMRDFDLVLPDGSVEPLEITQASNDVTRRTWARIEGLDTAAPTLTRRWVLSVLDQIPGGSSGPVPFPARDLLAAAPRFLAELEKAGILEFTASTWVTAGQAEPAVVGLVGLGCEFGMSSEVEAGESGRIILESGAGGWLDPNLIAEAVEREAAKPDNVAKLSEPPDARRRHLFVFLHPSTGAAWSVAANEDLGRLPILPSPITTVWVAATEGVHSTTPPEGWAHHGLPDDVYARPEKWIDQGLSPS